MDIPRLTVYIGPVWNEDSHGPDTGFARDPDKTLLYGDAGCDLVRAPGGMEVSGQWYVYKQATLGMAPTPLVGTATEKSDYNFGPGETQAATWRHGPNDSYSGKHADSPATIADGTTWSYPDPTHVVWQAVGAGGYSRQAMLDATLALAPVSAPDADVNYVAGWRHGTSDHSVAMINVKAGATAGAAMTQPNGASWAAGGIVCVLDRQ
ncbi:hypothetical protein EJH19_25560 [Salmonella enterica subsp. enterica serovar Vitkin]|nr:hypothetical protein [Salmonella enterica subsp. enterica serovar Vitkin]